MEFAFRCKSDSISFMNRNLIYIYTNLDPNGSHISREFPNILQYALHNTNNRNEEKQISVSFRYNVELGTRQWQLLQDTKSEGVFVLHSR